MAALIQFRGHCQRLLPAIFMAVSCGIAFAGMLPENSFAAPGTGEPASAATSARAAQPARTTPATPSIPTLNAPPTVRRWQPYIAEASSRFAIPQAWIAAVMQAESHGLTQIDGRPITSRAGAMGLMQLMPRTWTAMRRQYGLGPDPHDPHDNILAGTAYLKAMHDRFGYPGLFAAYNAGPGRYEQHLRTGTPLPGETRAYVARLAKAPASPDLPPAILSGTRLFFPLGQPGLQGGENGPDGRDQTQPPAGFSPVPRPQSMPNTSSPAPETAPKHPSPSPRIPTVPDGVSPSSGGLFVPRTPVPGGQP